MYCLFWGNMSKTSYWRVFLLTFDLYILTQHNPASISFSFCLKCLSLLLISLVYLQLTFSMAAHFQSISLLMLTLWFVIAAYAPSPPFEKTNNFFTYSHIPDRHTSSIPKVPSYSADLLKMKLPTGKSSHPRPSTF